MFENFSYLFKLDLRFPLLTKREGDVMYVMYA